MDDGLSFATNQNNLLLQLKGLSSTEDYVNQHRKPGCRNRWSSRRPSKTRIRFST